MSVNTTHFPVISRHCSPARKYGDFRIREVNMSGWTSDKAAHDWYVASGVHKEIVKKYYGGGLEGFRYVC